MQYTAHEFTKYVPAIHPASYGAAANTAGVEVDTLGFDEAASVISLGASTATGDVVFEVHECATSGGTFTKITGSENPATGDFDTTEDEKARKRREKEAEIMAGFDDEIEVDA